MGYIGVVYIAFLCFLRMRVRVSLAMRRGGEGRQAAGGGEDRAGRAGHATAASPLLQDLRLSHSHIRHRLALLHSPPKPEQMLLVK